jgi:DNA-binding MarR family transcriptional regulator
MDVIDEVRAAWHRERPDIDVSSIGILSRTMRIAGHLARARQRALRELGTDPVALEVLAPLRRAGPPYRLRTGALEAASFVTAGAISQRLARLEREGLIARERDPADRRVIYVALTRKGRNLIDNIVAGLMEREERLLASLSQTERRQLEKLLTTWMRALDQSSASGEGNAGWQHQPRRPALRPSVR